ncbi:MAG: SAM-dependent methyltransferase [Elusimicrobia bacterium]|nr:SAM-dependent methyltransferase [Elusimicrobiota bacterium]
MRTFHFGQAGFEGFLAKEAGACLEKGPGWVLSSARHVDLCFAHLSFMDPVELRGSAVNALAGALADYFFETSKDLRYDAVWPLCFESAASQGLSARRQSVEAAFREKTGRMARVMRLAEPGRPGLGPAQGLFVYLADFGRAFACRDAWGGGQRRMSDDPQAPSRSYLKVEEAYAVLRESPQAGETVVDLGAAPGGWSYSAAKRGAEVLAVDNGPLKGAAKDNPLIRHAQEDAFKFQPAGRADWLFCDIIAPPERSLELLLRWVENGWCRKFVVNLKFGRTDPFPLLRRVEAELAPRCTVLRPRHLYHDREELTVPGIARIA